MHPADRIRGIASSHLRGRRIVLAVCGSIAAVKTVELARELIRHGADVVPVMTESATRILHPDALEFATGRKPITRLSGQVEHVSLLGAVPDRADLLLVAPATANTVAKMALGIDDSPVTTCATVAFGTKVPIVVAPAMHEAMLEHPIVAQHHKTLVGQLGVTWVEPLHEEAKAKLADVDAIVDAVIHRLARDDGAFAGVKALVISGATEEPIDPVRILTNRSSGRTGHILATELHRLGADIELWDGRTSEPGPSHVPTTRYTTHADLMALVKKGKLARFGLILMPAAIGDYHAAPAKAKIASEQKHLTLDLKPLPKVIEAVRKAAPKAKLVAFKAESDAKGLEERARERLKRYKADVVLANTHEAFGAEATDLLVVHRAGATRLSGPKPAVLRQALDLIATLRGAK